MYNYSVGILLTWRLCASMNSIFWMPISAHLKVYLAISILEVHAFFWVSRTLLYFDPNPILLLRSSGRNPCHLLFGLKTRFFSGCLPYIMLKKLKSSRNLVIIDEWCHYCKASPINLYYHCKPNLKRWGLHNSIQIFFIINHHSK